jgi:hypothetical protein
MEERLKQKKVRSHALCKVLASGQLLFVGVK